MGNVGSTPSIDPLTLLRSNPEKAFKDYVYTTAEIPGVSTTEIGGCVVGEGSSCSLTYCFDGPNTGKRVVVLKSDVKGMGSGDYYYPWVNNPKGVGLVKVPLSAPHQTIVVTTAMNGCALQVNKTKDNYYFMHEHNAKSLNSGFLGDKGERVLRIEPTLYDPEEAFSKAALKYNPHSSPKHGETFVKNFGAYLFAVRTEKDWKVYANCVIQLAKITDNGLQISYDSYLLPKQVLGQFS